jgi:hypothetical protein
MSTSYGEGTPDANTAHSANSTHTKKNSNESKTFVWIGVATDVLLFVCGFIMLFMTSGTSAKAGGAYAWAKTLVGLTGTTLVVFSIVGVISSLLAVCHRMIKLISTALLIQSISIVGVIVLQILALSLFFSFFGSLQSADSRAVDAKYPVFSNFANCTWNTCCALTHVRERSFTKLDCSLDKTGVHDLSAVCMNLPRESSNATACVGGDGLVEFRQDLSGWIFGEVMSWSWIVVTLVIVEVVSFVVYCLRWNSVRNFSSEIDRAN